MKTAHTLAAATVLIVILSSLPAAATSNPTAGDPVRAALAHTMAVDAWPAGLVALRHTNEEVSTYASGVREFGSPEKVGADSQIRIGSNTKTFTSAVVLQLVGEGAISLDDAVETYLPGVVQHPQVTGEDITIRQLLQHTSGLPDMDGDIGAHLLEWQHRYISPRASLDLALAHPVSNVPGEAFEYSNSNYIVAGLIIEAVAGRPLAEVIDERIITPLGLEDTYFPDQGEEIIRGDHPHSYIPLGDSPVDYTDFDPSWGYAAGAMVSTTEDLTAFYSALATGDVVADAQLAEMRQTIPAESLWEGAAYGLGLISFELSCGVTAWGHGGDVPGTASRVAATEDGRAAAIAVTQNPTSVEADARLRGLIDTAICSV
ncbi:serine hydrolase [Cryobacterium sp. SO1]|uniref:serine hydrolase domain-containing protein n=1 Tax=Cryobacterium sp. SO1 TaxID=1897061 RepID=UPI0010233720|nr:serine hydrolase domain-containing protein [Cryobacterium sp. SO1]RZI34762.1 D-alanyl-D-alanine carboxypeptidase [Cryobacterium sp. SO1]